MQPMHTATGFLGKHEHLIDNYIADHLNWGEGNAKIHVPKDILPQLPPLATGVSNVHLRPCD
jgi:hypothetical protein